MKYVFLALLAVFADGLLAQNAPVVIVTSLGAQVPNAGGISVAANATFNSMGLAYDVSDPQNDGVGVTAVVSTASTAAACHPSSGP